MNKRKVAHQLQTGGSGEYKDKNMMIGKRRYNLRLAHRFISTYYAYCGGYIFGFVENSMKGSFIRKICIVRANAKIGMMNLT